MKLTDDIVKALHRSITEGYESVSEFARLANVSADTVTKYLRKETQSIKDETWNKIYPLIRPYLGKKPPKSVSLGSKYLELSTDQRILLDTFGDLPENIQKQKLLEIVALARKYNQEKQNK